MADIVCPSKAASYLGAVVRISRTAVRPVPPPRSARASRLDELVRRAREGGGGRGGSGRGKVGGRDLLYAAAVFLFASP